MTCMFLAEVTTAKEAKMSIEIAFIVTGNQ